MEKIFSAEAPKYWDAGLSAIPLKLMEKRPALNQWSEYCSALPSAETKEAWLRNYEYNNIGLALGAASGVVCIDIDHPDPKVEEAIMSVIPKSPWRRVGMKGCVMAYRFSGEPPKKLIDAKGNMVVEILSTGNQVVLPPSIHPKTQLPYEANCNLYDIKDQLPPLPQNVEEKLRAALSTVVELNRTVKGGTRIKVTENVAAGTRDVKMTRMAGMLAHAIIQGNCTLHDAILDMQTWCEEKFQHIDGDNIDIPKALGKIVEFLRKEVEVKKKKLPPGWDAEITPVQKAEWKLEFTDDQQQWPIDMINEFIFTEFEKIKSPTDPKRREIVEFVLKKVSVSDSLSNMEVDLILKQLKQHCGLDLPIGSFVKMLKELKAGPIEGLNHTELALETIKTWEDRFGKLAYHQGKMWTWVGNQWVDTKPQEILKLIAEEYGSLLAAKKWSDHTGILKIIQQHVPQFLSALPQQGVNFQNGFLTSDLRLVPHAPEQGMSYVMDYSYLPEAADRCPKFQAYLKSAWGHHPDFEDKRRALQEAMAVTFMNCATSYQRAFFLYGPGSTGKSVILDIIDKLVPESTLSALPPEKWDGDFSTSALVGVLLNRAGETDKDKKINGATFKSVISGEPMEVQFKRQDFFRFVSKAAHWFAGNDFPKSTDTSDGFNRRWLIFTFDKVVPANEKIKDLGKMIAFEEMEAIVAWALQAIPGLTNRGDYTLCQSHINASRLMGMTNSNIRQWLADKVVDKEGGSMKAKEAWSSYWGFCASIMSTRRMTPAQFHADLTQILMEQGRFQATEGPDGKVYQNIELKGGK